MKKQENNKVTASNKAPKGTVKVLKAPKVKTKTLNALCTQLEKVETTHLKGMHQFAKDSMLHLMHNDYKSQSQFIDLLLATGKFKGAKSTVKHIFSVYNTLKDDMLKCANFTEAKNFKNKRKVEGNEEISFESFKAIEKVDKDASKDAKNKVTDEAKDSFLKTDLAKRIKSEIDKQGVDKMRVLINYLLNNA